METLKEPITWAAGMLAAAAGFVARHSLGTRKSLSDHKLHAAETFATKIELKDAVKTQNDLWVRIDNKLDDALKRMK